jgi:hypothetical protein
MAQVERTRREAYNDMAVSHKKPAADHQKPQQAHPRQKGEAELEFKYMSVRRYPCFQSPRRDFFIK